MEIKIITTIISVLIMSVLLLHQPQSIEGGDACLLESLYYTANVEDRQSEIYKDASSKVREFASNQSTVLTVPRHPWLSNFFAVYGLVLVLLGGCLLFFQRDLLVGSLAALQVAHGFFLLAVVVTWSF